MHDGYSTSEFSLTFKFLKSIWKDGLYKKTQQVTMLN